MSELKVTKTVFDLDSKDDVTLVKTIPYTPVTSMQEALAKVNHDGAKMLEIVNAGLESYTKDTAKASADGWQVENEDGTFGDFTGTTLTEEKSKQLQVNALNMAKLLFGYSKDAEKVAKREAKQKAMDMLLGNPAVIEALKG